MMYIIKQLYKFNTGKSVVTNTWALYFITFEMSLILMYLIETQTEIRMAILTVITITIVGQETKTGVLTTVSKVMFIILYHMTSRVSAITV